MAICRVCNSELIEGVNWYVSFKRTHQLLCISCVKSNVTEWRNKNRDAFNEWARQYKRKKEAYYTEYRQKNKEDILTSKRNRCKEVRLEVLGYYSNNTFKCACCGESILEFLCIDHINGGGNKHRKQIRTGAGERFYRYLIRNSFPGGYQVLCYNCNFAKGMYGYCPHNIIPH